MAGEPQAQRSREALNAFLDAPLDAALAQVTDPQEAALGLFRTVVTTVPAYRAFLHEHDVDPASVQTYEAFQRLPLTNKPNYIRRYPLAERCHGGRLEACDFIAVSSGSTGEPTVWPRFLSDEYPVARRFEQVFHDSFRADECRTLAVVCFALGTWVGGMYTASCLRHLAAKGYPITIATPGNNRAEILRVVHELGPLFEQVILLGYPPFLKDVIDLGLTRGIDWPRHRVRLVMAGEVFSEEWRTLVGERAGMDAPLFDSASLYGTADAGVLANETPLSICIRRYLAAHPSAARALFGESRLPTLAQYDPLVRFFEVHEGTLLFSGDNGAPLMRYHIADTGGLFGFDELLSLLHEHGFDPLAALGTGARGARRLPFVYVFGRADFTVSFYGANIYPENVTVGLEQPAINAWVTGKFVLEVREDGDHNPFLAVVVELAPGVEPQAMMPQAIAESVRQQLLRLNSEFAAYVPVASQLPRIALVPAGDPQWFPVGVKHRYTRRPAGL